MDAQGEKTDTNIEMAISFLNALQNVVDCGLYLVDGKTMSTLYTTPLPLSFIDLPDNQEKETGELLYEQHLDEEQKAVSYDVFRSAVGEFCAMDREKRRRSVLVCEFAVHFGKKEIVLFHRISPFLFDDENQLFIAAVMFSSKRKSKARPMIITGDSKDALAYENGSWITARRNFLSKEELKIMRLSLTGLTSEEIADEECVSVHTIKTHKRRMYEKLGAKTITDAICCARNYGLLGFIASR